jgi:hypothetical protein
MAMANFTKVALLLVFLQMSCAVSWAYAPAVNFPATMTLNGFAQGEGGGDPAECDGQYHSDDEFIVSLSSKWFVGGARCGKFIRIQNNANNLHMIATVVDECRDCDNEVGASAVIWRNFHLDPSVGEWSISWSDVVN